MSAAYVEWYGGERRQSWATPPALFDPLHAEYRFTLDGASEPGNGLLPRASTAVAPIPWEGERVFCNPPWSNIAPFVDLGATVRYFKPKPRFVGAKSNSPADCVLLVFGAA